MFVGGDGKSGGSGYCCFVVVWWENGDRIWYSVVVVLNCEIYDICVVEFNGVGDDNIFCFSIFNNILDVLSVWVVVVGVVGVDFGDVCCSNFVDCDGRCV